jgi:AAA15 family ATPase/GTPase
MLQAVELVNFGLLEKISWDSLGAINLITGNNGSGKTSILKALYSTVKALEGYQRGDDNKTLAELLSEKLYWTFQVDKIGDLVRKGQDEPLRCKITMKDKFLQYHFTKNLEKQIRSLENYIEPRTEYDSIFLPAKEILSLHKIILKSRDNDKLFGFDDTYVDLARAIQLPSQRKTSNTASAVRKKLDELLGGRVEYDNKSAQWRFGKGGQKFPIGVTAEGVKKLALLDTLLGNKYLKRGSIVFIDEPESALHPEAISVFLECIADLAFNEGIQFFMATHSYFVIKKLYLIAQQKECSIPILACEKEENQMVWRADDLLNGMPENAIINEAIHLYEEELELP